MLSHTRTRWTLGGLGLAVTLLTVACEPRLEVETFELQRLAASQAAALVSPYVYPERDGAPGALDFNDRLLTVRETPQNLERIRALLSQYDRPAANLTLQFQLVEADGFQSRDPSIADVEAELRSLLRYEGYRLVGDAVVQIREGERAQLQIDRAGDDGDEPPFQLHAEVSRVSRSAEGEVADVAVVLEHPWYDRLLDTRVTVGAGTSMVLGTTSAGLAEAEAMILVLRPTVQSER